MILLITEVIRKQPGDHYCDHMSKILGHISTASLNNIIIAVIFKRKIIVQYLHVSL